MTDEAQAAEGLTAQVYNVNGQNNAPFIPQGASPVLTTNVPNINFQWGGDSVLGGPSEDVIVRFSGSILSNTTQNISFLAIADDGTRLYIDGALIADDWFDKGGGGTTSAPTSFTAGIPKTIELMYYENGGGANVFLYWNQSGSMQIIPESAFTSQAAPVVKTIGAPRNLTVLDNGSAAVLSWEAPNTGNTLPERYAISFSADGGGWGIATGNVGDANALNTTITISYSLLESLKPSGTIWTFSIRSDNDTNSLYSQISNQITIKIGKTQAEKDAEAAAALAIQQELDRQAAADTAVTNYENQPITTLEDVSVAEYLKSISDTATAIVLNPNVKLSLESRIDARSLIVASTKASLTQAKLEADAAALIVQQAAAAQAEAERQAALAAEAARIEAQRVEADRLAAIAEAARIESERLAAIAAQAEVDRIAAEKAAADALAAQQAADALAAQQAADAELARLVEVARLAEIARTEAERLAGIAEANRLESERLAAIAAENARLAEVERLAEEKRLTDLSAEKARQDAINAEKDRLAEIAKQAAIKAEQDRIAAELLAQKAESDRLAAEERAKIQAEINAKAEADRIAAEKAIADAKAAQEKAAAEARVAEEARIAAEKAAKEAEAARLKAEEDARIQAEKDAQAKADAEKAEVDRLKAEADAKAKAEEDARLEAIKKADEEARAKDEAERKAREEAKAKAEAEKQEQIAKDKAAEESRIQAEQKAKEAEAARLKAEIDRKIAEEKALNDGKITAEDTKKVLDNINSDGKVTQQEVKNIVEAIKQSDKPLTSEQKDLIATVVVAAAISSGENVTAAQIQSAGIEYKDLPASTPVEVRTSESGEALIITAEVAASVELVQDPGALLEAAFSDPGAALQALGSIGADMTEGEREEATEMVVATVVAAGAAINAASVAAGGATGGGGSSGGGGASGANSPGSRGGRKW